MTRVHAGAIGAVLLLLGTWVGHVLATGAPQQSPLTYAGTITDVDGKPFVAAQDVVIALYDAPSGGSAKCKSATVQAEAGTGRFTTVLPPECAQAVHDHPDLWVEATVGAGKVVLPRMHIGASPYALQAEVAKNAVTATTALSAKAADTAAGASGALKASLDAAELQASQISAKVDALAAEVAKAQPAGGGAAAARVVDINGMVLGVVLGFPMRSYQLATSGTSSNPSYSLKVGGENDFALMTPKGYIVETGPAWSLPSPHVYFSKANCNGDAATSGLAAFGMPFLRSRVFFAGGSAWVVKGDAGQPVDASENLKFTSLSRTYGDKACAEPSTATSNSTALLLTKLSYADLGWPAAPTPPLRIVP